MNTLDLLQDLLKKAKTAGATSADVVLSDATSLSVSRRMGKAESIERSEDAEIGLRVFVGHKTAMVSSSDRSPEALQQMAERAVAMAKSVPDDLYAGIADAADVATHFPDLDLFDATEISIETMNEYADRAEAAARSVKGITNSDGAEFAYGRDHVYYVASNGFVGHYQSSGFTISAAVIAGKDTDMVEDYDYDSGVYFKDLRPPEEIGHEAATRAVKALNPKKVSTTQVPVVFDRRIGSGLIGSLASAISGTSVARGTTMLKDKLGQQIFGKNIQIIDDPFLKRGSRSRPFDGEGIAPQKRNIIQDGVLTSWMLDLTSARQLKLKTTGNAARGSSSPPSPRPANFYMQAGTQSVTELIKDIDRGLFVTSMMGSGGNIVTGDYSRGAKGFWIEKGVITYPVAEITIAGNLKDMWLNCTPANDLQLKQGIDVPTLRIDTMTVAGA